MCGIAEYAGLHRPEILEPMCAAMAHRGPDDAGTWHDAEAEVGLGHRRLSILDLSAAGHQPMSSADGRLWISYNGEIYNFREHRERLAQRGYPFRSQTDTEVILALYQERGLDFPNELNGIFALASWDADARQLLLARDHVGIKPLYYAYDRQRLYFASEIKALLAIPGLRRELDLPGIADYLRFLWVPGENTLLSGVKKLEPGHFLTWWNGKVDTRQWFRLRYEPDDSVSEPDWVEAVGDTFMRSIRRQTLSDVPLGAFLSGGLDSSSIVSCMRQAHRSRQITSYTVRFDPGDRARDWLREANVRAIARQLRLSWEQVAGIQARGVKRGLAPPMPKSPRQIGVDETSFQKRHEYVTVVHDIDEEVVVHVADDC